MIGSYRKLSPSDFSKYLTPTSHPCLIAATGIGGGLPCSHLTYGKWEQRGAKEALRSHYMIVCKVKTTLLTAGLLRPNFIVFDSKKRSYNRILKYSTELCDQNFLKHYLVCYLNKFQERGRHWHLPSIPMPDTTPGTALSQNCYKSALVMPFLPRRVVRDPDWQG